MILDVWSLHQITFLTSSAEPPAALKGPVETAMRHFEKRLRFLLAVDDLETYLKRNQELKYQPDFSSWGTSSTQASQGYHRLLRLSRDTATFDDLTEAEQNACEAVSRVRYAGMDGFEANQTYKSLKEKFFPSVRQEIHALIATLEKMGFRHKLTDFQYLNPSSDPRHDWGRILIEFEDPA